MRWIKKLIEEFENNKKISWIILIIILITITYCSSIPGSSLQFNSIWPSVIYHFSVFAGFGFALKMLISKKERKRKDFFIVVCISLLVAILDEFHQIFVPFRSPDIKDILTDMGGVIFSMIIYSAIKKIKD